METEINKFTITYSSFWHFKEYTTLQYTFKFSISFLLSWKLHLYVLGDEFRCFSLCLSFSPSLMWEDILAGDRASFCGLDTLRCFTGVHLLELSRTGRSSLSLLCPIITKKLTQIRKYNSQISVCNRTSNYTFWYPTEISAQYAQFSTEKKNRKQI